MPKHARIASTLFAQGTFGVVKPLMHLAALAALAETVLIALLFALARLPAGQAQDKYVFFILAAFGFYLTLGRKFKMDLHGFFEAQIAEIRLKVMELVRGADLRSFEQVGAEYVYTALTFDVRAISELSHTIAATTYAAFLLVSVLLYLAILSEYAFFLTVALVIGIGYFYARNQDGLQQLIQQIRAQETGFFEALHDLLGGFKELRLDARKNDDFFQTCLQPRIEQLRQLRLQAAQYFVQNDVLTHGLWQALILAPVLLLPVLGILSRDVLLTFLGVILFIPTNYLVEEIPRILLAAISIQRLAQLDQTLTTLTPETFAPLAPAAQLHFTELQYQDITFQYAEPDGRPFTIGPLSLTLRPGETVFLTGGNGSGKTTLLKLLTGLYPIDAGQIRLNGQAVAIEPYRRLFAPVFSEVYLFDRFYGLDAVDAGKINELLALMQLDEKVQFTDQRFTTLELSTGQQKRLALVAALIEDKPIYVFDEWAAEQDPAFRAYFYLQLLPALKAQGKTVLAVTHDDRYFHAADRLLKMEYGKLMQA